MYIALTFIGMAVAAWAVWQLLRRQEKNDPEFQRHLSADERRARINRQTDANDALARDAALKAGQARQQQMRGANDATTPDDAATKRGDDADTSA